jgi:phosphate transport system substrate-binding protein
VRSSKWLLAVGACLGVLALGIGVAACGSSSNDNGSASASSGSSIPGGTINGAGSTFVQPLVEEWGKTVSDQDGLTVNYTGNGSGAGQAQLINGTVDFAGSDPPLEPSQFKQVESKNGTSAVQIPVAFGAVTLSYNVPGLDTGLKLDGTTIADVFLGKVTKWNDPEIAKLNPGTNLPSSDITVIHRSDDSGTTKLFTTFLSDYSPTWKSQVGADSTVKWPTGTGANGNDGVAGAIKQTSGSIGYVELAYALQSSFTTASVKNSSGNYVAPDLKSTTAAAENIKLPSNLGVLSVNAPGADSYPIASASHLMTYKDLCKAGLSKTDAQNVVGFLDYVLGPGQDTEEKLSYAKLPSNILGPAKQAVGGLECNGSPVS